jgi:dGTPase
MAKDICKQLLDRQFITTDQAKSIETIAATCGLLHDLGNPPFGHSGEVAIRDWFPTRQPDVLKALEEPFAKDFLKFDGNAQTLRLVTHLQILADYHGLDLTCGTLSAACKYVAASNEIADSPHERSKVGFFVSERDDVAKIREKTGTGQARNPIAFLVEAADDAVYNAVDLEDGFSKGILDWAFLTSELKKACGDDEVLKDCVEWTEGRLKNPEVPLRGRAKDGALIQYFRVRAIGNVVTACAKAFLDHYDEIMEGAYHGELVKDSGAFRFVKACSKLNRSRVYCSDETLKLELMGRKIIWDLMDLFWEGVKHADADPERKETRTFADKAFSLLSDNYRSVFHHAMEDKKLPETYCRLQLLTDYICGMTDTFAAGLHRKLMNG